MTRPLRLAHRGDWRRAPENSLAALVAGARAAASDGVEFDVRRSSDGLPVIIHDPDLARVQGIDARVEELTAAELERLGVPGLAAVLETLPRSAFLDIELKVPVDRETIEVLAGGRGPELHRAVISSFDPTALEGVAHLAPSWPRWLNVEVLDGEAIALADRLACRGISAEWHGIRAATAREVARAGLELAAWTARRRSTF
ncbi:MAG: glycerophosphodiester phosphodiesterase, partial [Candidatus Limnocylindrales bacterium]